MPEALDKPRKLRHFPAMGRIKKLFSSAPKKQLDLGFEKPYEVDRNYQDGGRSFYFFDFDDNVAYLRTPVVLFHKRTEKELHLASNEYYKVRHLLGDKDSPFEHYRFDSNDKSGSYKFFRDQDHSIWERLVGKKQIFEKDLIDVLKDLDLNWKAPSWDFFYHATFNKRPISIITARGHNPETLRKGMERFVDYGYLPHLPNFLAILPVSHTPTRKELGDTELKLSIPELKKLAIRKSVFQAIENYGEDKPHRFGMSDDDPANVDLIKVAMTDLKEEFPHMAFFVISTYNGKLDKQEISATRSSSSVSDQAIDQPKLFT